MKKKIKAKTIEEKIKEIYEKYPDREEGLKDWSKGGFVNDDKYKQPIKHKLYKK